MKRTTKRILLYGFSLPAGLVMGVAIFLAIQYPHRNSWMFWAAKNDHPWVARFLLAAGVPVEIKDEQGRMPLHWAAYLGYDDLAGLLIAKYEPRQTQPIGWDFIEDESGDTYFDLAVQQGHYGFVLGTKRAAEIRGQERG